jgi:hypothetical protein
MRISRCRAPCATREYSSPLLASCRKMEPRSALSFSTAMSTMALNT